MIEGPITKALKAQRRARWAQIKAMRDNNAHWFYKHIVPDPAKAEDTLETDDDGNWIFKKAEKRKPHTLEGHKAALEEGATSRHCMDRYNKLTNHVFDGIAHLIYGWPHMGDVQALIALQEITE